LLPDWLTGQRGSGIENAGEVTPAFTLFQVVTLSRAVTQHTQHRNNAPEFALFVRGILTFGVVPISYIA